MQGRKWGLWHRRGFSLGRTGRERPPLSRAISQSGSHPSPSLTQGDFCGSHNDLHRMTSLSVSNIFWFVAGVLFKHKFKRGWNSAESFCWTRTKGTVLLDVSVLVGRDGEEEERESGRKIWPPNLAGKLLPGPQCFCITVHESEAGSSFDVREQN